MLEIRSCNISNAFQPRSCIPSPEHRKIVLICVNVYAHGIGLARVSSEPLLGEINQVCASSYSTCSVELCYDILARILSSNLRCGIRNWIKKPLQTLNKMTLDCCFSDTTHTSKNARGSGSPPTSSMSMTLNCYSCALLWSSRSA